MWISKRTKILIANIDIIFIVAIPLSMIILLTIVVQFGWFEILMVFTIGTMVNICVRIANLSEVVISAVVISPMIGSLAQIICGKTFVVVIFKVVSFRIVRGFVKRPFCYRCQVHSRGKFIIEVETK